MAARKNFEDIANGLQLTGLNAVSLIRLIVNAARAARMHKHNCIQFAEHVELIGNLLKPLKMSEMRTRPETREPLEQLEKALLSSYKLVNSCQEKSYLYLMAMGWNIVQQFRRAHQEIDQYLKILPLIMLVDNARFQERLEEILKDRGEYTLDEDDRQLQVAISKNDPKILKKTISCSYPDLPIYEALEKEQEKLMLELQNSQANMDVGQCKVIERLLQVTVSAAGLVEKSPEMLEPDKGHISEESSPRKCDTITSSRETSINSGNNMAPTNEAIWQDEWHSDLVLDCCSDPSFCIKTFFFPCGALAKIASAATGMTISSGKVCNEIMAYTLILGCCCYTCSMRGKLRKRLNIKGGLFEDCLSHFMCCCCALVQECREAEIRCGPQETRTNPPPTQQMES